MDDSRFLREVVVDVDAATVGISRLRWVNISSQEASSENARSIMDQERFDVLPITDESHVTEYFCTERWSDFTQVSRNRITHRDLIPLTTPIRDVIKGFAQDTRHFYFLTHERRVTGLISVSNLNCRQVSVWLFSLFAELETNLAAFIDQHVTELDLLRNEFGPEAKERAAEIRKNYLEAREKGVDAPFSEYLYLSDLVNIVGKRKLFDRLGYTSRKQYDKQFCPVVDFRNKAAHPVRSLINHPEECMDLWNEIENLEACLFSIRSA